MGELADWADYVIRTETQETLVDGRQVTTLKTSLPLDDERLLAAIDEICPDHDGFIIGLEPDELYIYKNPEAIDG